MTRLVLALSLLTAPAVFLRAEDADYNRDVRPLLANLCFECHGPHVENREADLRFDVLDGVIGKDAVIVPGRPEKSPFVERLTSDDPDVVMPPPDSRRQPTAEQIESLRAWVEQGARSQPHWAFVPPSRPKPPAVCDPDWPRNPIDTFVLAHFDERGMTPRPDAEPRVLARRLSLVLTGLPVLPERADRFAARHAEDPEEAIAEIVDELLDSDAYGEHFAWGWMDAARYADTNGYQGDGPRVMWPWRDWLVRRLNENLPFDEMTERMLAGDLLLSQEHRDWQSADWIPDDDASERLLATGFLRNHRYDTGSGTIPAESRFENAADRLETVGTVWMGLTLQCARCHTHKYDPIESREYYELLSFFDKVPEVGSALKGASHPYVHVPVGEERTRLEKLSRAATEAESAYAAARDRLSAARAAWERDLTETGPRVQRGLRFRYAEKAMQFDGTNSSEASKEPVALCAGNRTWTISFWFKPEFDEDGAIFSSVEEPERYRPGIQADWVDGKVRVRHVCRWVNSYIEFESRERLAVGKWHHVTFRCDGRMQGLAYRASLGGVDAAMRCTHPVTNDSAEKAGKAPLVLGGSPLMPGFVGGLRDFRFYDRELNRAEVRSLADPRPTAAIAAIPREERSELEQRTLELAFLESDALPAEVARLRDAHFERQHALAEAIRATPTAMVMRDARRQPTHVRKAGVFDQSGEIVESGTPGFLPPLPEGRRDRLALARWLTSPENPLTARVAVNRIWQSLWGRGLVDSPENFGTQCAEPVHAELLDWLATEYVRLGWDTKTLVRTIVTSRAYRQSSGGSAELWKRDPENRHLARGPRYRLPVHTVRDQALFLGGHLDPTLGGPPVVLDEVRGKDGKPVRLPYEVNDCRRTLYTYWKRNSPHPLLAVFDVADRNQCDVRAQRTNTPLQALVTLNEPGFAESARLFGKRAREAARDDVGRLAWARQACTGREPDMEDREQLERMLESYRSTVDGDDDLAWTALCNVLLNLDATLTLE